MALGWVCSLCDCFETRARTRAIFVSVSASVSSFVSALSFSLSCLSSLSLSLPLPLSFSVSFVLLSVSSPFAAIWDDPAQSRSQQSVILRCSGDVFAFPRCLSRSLVCQVRGSLLPCDVFPCDRYVSVLRLVAALFCMLAVSNLTLLASGTAQCWSRTS
jgi:hypothetical protein